MKKRKLTSSQRKLLEKNPNILSTTEFHIVYTSEFKLKAIKFFEGGHSPAEILKKFGLDFDFITAEDCRGGIKRWRKLLKEKSKRGVLKENRGQQKLAIDNLSVNDLKALVKVQMGVIEELKKTKALAKKI